MKAFQAVRYGLRFIPITLLEEIFNSRNKSKHYFETFSEKDYVQKDIGTYGICPKIKVSFCFFCIQT